ncbi:carbohydrate ABC transporter permease [Nocardia africana]|uniref:sn-glycerol-3-phosphate transport system permease protein ugpA n=1 Tax=Nocardia africana TaxID=134964 RepID=A0A378WU36_9NOCA|nr:sugar ABC transporter permease [Nocardia africana]MCC3313887.1 sugar ABC transporter permease [Nocardia africana]SUA44728.1 sn-glycerol-3-phosphate transport system permease protein ugpA [Nocardia africana]
MTPSTPPARPRRISARRIARLAAPYLYLSPALLLLVVWTYQPLAQAVQLSTLSWNLLPSSPMQSVGGANYRRLLDLPAFWTSLGRTGVLIAGMLPFTVALPVLIALASRQVGRRARTLYHATIFAPFLVAPVAAAAVWRWLLHPRTGFVDSMLGSQRNWVYDAQTAHWVIIGITGWQLLGFAVLVVWSGLANISGDYDEAARVDGASSGQIRRWITLPLLSPTLLFLTLTTVLLSPTLTFPLIDTMTQGGPAGATTNIYYLLWDYAFHSFDAGLSAAAGVLLFVGFGAVAAVLVWISEKVAFHDD